jgi:hypothetical protein
MKDIGLNSLSFPIALHTLRELLISFGFNEIEMDNEEFTRFVTVNIAKISD